MKMLFAILYANYSYKRSQINDDMYRGFRDQNLLTSVKALKTKRNWVFEQNDDSKHTTNAN